MEVMKCDYCGTSIKSGERYCRSCGAVNKFFNADDELELSEKYQEQKLGVGMAKFIMVGMIIFCLILCSTIFATFYLFG